MREPPRRQFDRSLWIHADRTDRRDAACARFTTAMAAIGAMGVPACIAIAALVIVFHAIRFLGALL